MNPHLRTLSLALPAALVVLAGCASGPNRAPIEERKPVPARVAGVVAAGVAAPASPAAAPATPESPRPPPPGAENAGKPGYHTVKPGEVLVRIALENGQNWRDVQRWNNLENPNLIEVGQVLRVAPPAPADAGAASTRPVAPAGRVDSRPLDARPGATASAPASAPVTSPAPGPAPTASPAPSAPMAQPAPVAAERPAPARQGDDELQWQWPAAGPVATGFEEGRSKGVAITGRAGEPVLAAADGRVVYAGSGLRGYGNLVIVKHNTSYLSAYAHNQTLLVKEEQVVRKGQKIAEMGSSDADRVQLHFEVRRLGVPIDPMRVLPQR